MYNLQTALHLDLITVQEFYQALNNLRKNERVRI